MSGVGKMNRGLSVFHSYQLLKGVSEYLIPEDEVFRAHVLGWCVEWVRVSMNRSQDPYRSVPHSCKHSSWWPMISWTTPRLVEVCSRSTENVFFSHVGRTTLLVPAGKPEERWRDFQRALLRTLADLIQLYHHFNTNPMI